MLYTILKEVLKADGYDESIDLEGVNWSCLLDGKEPQLEETQDDQEENV